MSKEEFLKIQTCVLKVNIHCEGCRQKVKKILQKIDGVYTTNVDSEQGKVTVSGNVDPPTLIKKLTKNGKKAELWGAPKGNSNNGQNQVKNLQIDNGKGGNNSNKGGQKGGGGGGNNNQPKVGGGQNPQIKGFQDMKFPPQFGNDLNLPQLNGKEPKPGKFLLRPEDEGLTEDDIDEFDDDYYYDDDGDGLDDDLDDAPLPPPGKMKPQMPNMAIAGQHQLMKGGNNGKKEGSGGGGGNIPVQMNLGGDVKGGKKGGNGGGGGKGGKNNGGQPQNGGGQNKNSGGGKEGGGINHGMPNMMMPMSSGPAAGNMPVGHMGNPPMNHHQMANLAVQGLPAMGGGGGSSGAGPAGYFQGNGGPGPGSGPIAENPYYQQQLAAMMMNQQRVNANERFQPMMYAPPPPAVNYMPPYPYQRADQDSMFSDENPASCTLM